MQLLLVIELLCTTTPRPTEVFLDALDACRDYSGQRQPGPHKLLESTQLSRKVSVVLFGKFFLEEIFMPRVTKDVSVTLLVAVPVDNQPGFRNTNVLLRQIFTSSGQPNHYTSYCEAARPPLQCVQYILRRYCNLRFADEAFEVHIDSPYRMLYTNGDLFLEDTIHGYCPCEDGRSTVGRLLTSADKPRGNLHYRRTY